MPYRNLAQAALAGVALSGVITACGSGGSPNSGASSPAGGSTGGVAAAQIKANWVAFFNAKTPVAQRVSLLQHGTVFEPLIRAQATSALASSA